MGSFLYEQVSCFIILILILTCVIYIIRIFIQVTEYEYDAPMEEHYRASLFKSFNKTLDDGYFPVIVIDAINHKVAKMSIIKYTLKLDGFVV